MSGAGDSWRRGFIAWMAERPIAANLVMVMLVGAGIWTAIHVHKEVYPRFELDKVDVTVGYPGAAPSEVEQGVIAPIEEAIRAVAGIRDITSTASEGEGRVEVELVGGADRMKAFQDIDQAISRIRTFPDDIVDPEVRLAARRRGVLVVALYGDVDVWTIRQLAEGLRDALVAHPAITQVGFWNLPEYITHVEIPQHRLREYGLTLDDVARRIEASSQDVPAGTVEANDHEVLLRVAARKLWADDLEQVPVIATEAGAVIRLGELGTIRDGFEDLGFHSRFNDQPSISLIIERVGDQSPLDVAAGVREVLASFETTLPPGVHIRTDRDAAEDYRDRLSLLVDNGLSAVLIVLLILGLFLQLRVAFWVMIGMVVAFVGGMALMPALGVSVNMVSMFGFLVVLGIVVDDAVVVGENVHEYRQQGMSPLEAAVRGTRDIAGPVGFAVVSNIVAFVPLMVLPGTTGQFWWPLPVVVIAILAISLVEAFVILPAHLAHEPAPAQNVVARAWRAFQGAFARGFAWVIATLYRPVLDLTLRWRYVTLTAASVLLWVVGTYAVSDHMGLVGMPEVPADEIEAGVRLPIGTTPDRAAAIAQAVTDSTEAMFERHGLEAVSEGIKTNVRRGYFIDVELVMRPPDQRDMSAREVIELWRSEIGDLEGVHRVSFEAERGPGGWQDDISVDLAHADFEVLQAAAERFMAEMEGFEATRDVNDNLNLGKAQLSFELLDEGQRLGFTATDVGRQVRAAFFGALATRQLRGQNEVEIRVKLPEADRKQLRTLDGLVLRAPNGAEVPLSEVARMVPSESFSSISRRNGRRAVTVGMDVEPARLTGQVVDAIKADVLPALRADFPGLTWTFEGSQAELRKSTTTLWGWFALAMALIFGLLAVAFGSYTQPLIVMSAIPFGIVGAVLGHIVLGHDVSLLSLMGVIALSGVVVNDSLIMVDYANKQRTEHGLSAFEAIRQAGLRRFRPILLTTLTTAGGLTPILLERSLQAQYLIPMAISLGFGILFATAIILVIVPCLYMVLEDLTPASVRTAPARRTTDGRTTDDRGLAAA